MRRSCELRCAFSFPNNTTVELKRSTFDLLFKKESITSSSFINMLWKSNDFSSRYFQKYSTLFALLSHLGILFLGGAALPARNVATAGARDEQIMLLPHLRSSDLLMRFHPHTVNKILGRQLFRPGDDACMESPFSYYPDVTSPDFFLYYESAFKDFTSYFDVDDSGLGVFTDLLELFKAPCEFVGGTLYNITGTQACYDEDLNYTMTDFDFPYCAPKGCVIDKELVESSEDLIIALNEKMSTSTLVL